MLTAETIRIVTRVAGIIYIAAIETCSVLEIEGIVAALANEIFTSVCKRAFCTSLHS